MSGPYHSLDGIYKQLSPAPAPTDFELRVRQEECDRDRLKLDRLERLLEQVIKPRLVRLRMLVRACRLLGSVLTQEDLAAMRPEVRLALVEIGRSLKDLQPGDDDVPATVVAR